MHGVKREGGGSMEGRVRRINNELRRLKDRCESEGLGQEETLERLVAHAEGKLRAAPALSGSHRFSWVSGEVEKRMLPREEV